MRKKYDVTQLVALLLLTLTMLVSLTGCLNTNDEGEALSIESDLNLRPDSAQIMAGTTFLFNTNGGVPPYSYRILSGAGSIHPETGLFTSSLLTGNVLVEVTDSEGSTDVSSLQISELLRVTPSSSSIVETTSLTLTASGGVPPYSFALTLGPGQLTQGSPTTATYVAAPGAGSALVLVTDTKGNVTNAVISIKEQLLVTPHNHAVPDNSEIEFTVVGGQPQYTFTQTSGATGSFPSHGIFKTPSTPGSVTIRVADEVGFFKDAVLSVFKALRVAPGQEHTCAVNTAGALKCWGHNWYGQTGSGFSVYGDSSVTMGDNLIPVNVGTGLKVIAVQSNAVSTCAIVNSNPAATSGDLKCWGENNGTGLPGTSVIGAAHTSHVGDEDGEMGDALPIVPFAGGHQVKKVVMGTNSTCVHFTNNQARCFGANSTGSTMPMETSTKGSVNVDIDLDQANTGLHIIDIFAGWSHTCVIFSNYSVKCFGSNSKAQLGPQNVGGNLGTSTFHIGAGIQFINFGLGSDGSTPRGMKQLAIGTLHTCGIIQTPAQDKGKVLCWGDNSNGKLGLGFANSGATAVIGDVASEISSQTAVNLGTSGGQPLRAVQIVAGNHHTCAIVNTDPNAASGALKCWGQNVNGALGFSGSGSYGDDPSEMGDALSYALLPVKNSGVTTFDRYHPVEKISASVNSSCALIDVFGEKKVKCWGTNAGSRLGMNSTAASVFADTPGYVELSSTLQPKTVIGPKCTDSGILALNPCVGCAVMTDGSLKCWGRPRNGNLGKPNSFVGDSILEMGENLPVVSLGTGLTIKEVAANSNRSCAILSNGRVKCWGENPNKSLGIDDFDSRGDNPGEMGDALPFVDLADTIGGAQPTVGQICVGENFACAVMDPILPGTSGLKCWGGSTNNQLGRGIGTTHTTPIAMPYTNLGSEGGVPLTAKKVSCGYGHTCAVTSTGKLKCWGTNNNGQLGRGHTTIDKTEGGAVEIPYTNLSSSASVLDVAAGEGVSCAVLSDRTLKCWGKGDRGQLGSELTTNISDEPSEVGDGIPVVSLGSNFTPKHVYTAGENTCVLSIDGKVKCFGRGSTGINGNQFNFDLGNNAGHMGNTLQPIDLGPGRTALSLQMSSTHVCAVLDNNLVKCWGSNTYGELGIGDRTPRGSTNGTMGTALPYVPF